jgi:putative heme-binding domain-containing protein
VRAWTVRLIGDESRELSAQMRDRLVRMAVEDGSPTVRSQLACTAKRLPAVDGLAIVARLLRHSEDAGDTHLPLLIWWAVESKATTHADEVLALLADQEVWQLPLVRDTLIERLTKRYAAEKNDAGYAACARLLALAPTGGDVTRVVAAMESDLTGARLAGVPQSLAAPLEKLWQANPNDPTLTRLALRLGMHEAYDAALARMADPAAPLPARLSYITVVGQTGDPAVVERLLPLLDQSHDETIRTAALSALARFDNDQIAAAILDRYPDFSPALRARAISLLASRPSWAAALVAAVAAKNVAATDVSVDQVRQMIAHNDAGLAHAIEAHWGKIRPATPGEKMAYVPVLGRVLAAGAGDRAAGHALFVKHCATCHTLFGEGAKVGPDLTSADRKNREALLLNILDPSGYVRPEFVAQTAVLVDGRVLTGLVTESSAQAITLVDAKNQRTTVPRGDVEEIQPSEQSLMPERLLEVLQPQEVRDLFSYLQGEGPAPAAASGGE